MNATEAAHSVIDQMADEATVEKAEAAVRSGAAEWIFDPQVDGVVALVKKGTRVALVVVYYKEADFETGEEFETGLYEEAADPATHTVVRAPNHSSF